MQKKYLVPTIALIITFSSAFHAFAASPSPSTSPSPSPTVPNINEVTENLKKRLLENKDNPENLPTASYRGYVGVVKDFIKDTLVIEDKDGKKDIKLNDSTNIVRAPGNTAIKPENIRIDDYIIAIGVQGESDSIIGKRLIVSADPIKPPLKASGIGSIEKIGKTSLTLKSEGDKEVILDFTTKTIFKSKEGLIEVTDLKVGDSLIYTATIDDKDNLTATILMRVPKI